MLEIIKRLEHYAKVQPQSIALQIDDEIVNYENLYQKICDCTLNLPKFKLGSRVALLSDSPIVNITNYFVVLMMDGVPCFLDNK
ncbi:MULTISPECIES: hypothetical protein [Staphylococcus]|nr:MULTISPECIES: hypothetical protein [Staphylococcus]WRV64527.1 hypothetical protein VQ623_10485 [Staphylococcus haemolyticus]